MHWWTAILAAGFVVGLPLFLYSWFVEPRRGRFRQETLELEDLPPGLDGLTILHLSDLHLTQGDRGRARLIRELSAVEADIIAITGDFIEADRDVDFCVETLSGLRARYGVFGVLGNHDYAGDRSIFDALLHFSRRRNNVGRLVRKMEAAGIRFLVNESRPLQIDGHKLWLVGVDDPHRWRHSLRRALANVPADSFRVLLAHSPDVMDQLPYHRVDVVLCGHTHGGQVVLPLLGAPLTRTRYPLRPASGWRRVGRAWMHISRGIGGSLPLRFGCPPEANLIQFKTRPRVAPRVAVSRQQSAVSGK